MELKTAVASGADTIFALSQTLELPESFLSAALSLYRATCSLT